MKGVLKNLIIYLYWFPFRCFVQLLPSRIVYIIGQLSGIVLSKVLRGKKLALERELSIFYNKEQDKEFNKIVKNAFKILCQNELETLLFPKFNEKNIDSFVEYSGIENVDNALLKGKGVMLLFAHFGANQMIMPAIGYKGYKLSQLSAPPMAWKDVLPDKKFSKMSDKALTLRWQYEESLPVKHINIFGSLKKAFLCLKKNEILGIAMDGGGGKDRVAIDFLGRKALFSTGAMEIAMRTGCIVLPTFMVRTESGKNRLIIDPPLKLLEKESCSNALDKNMAAFVKRFNEFVLNYPCHYLNFLTLRRFMESQGEASFLVKGDT